jgi:hypothetical protein
MGLQLRLGSSYAIDIHWLCKPCTQEGEVLAVYAGCNGHRRLDFSWALKIFKIFKLSHQLCLLDMFGNNGTSDWKWASHFSWDFSKTCAKEAQFLWSTSVTLARLAANFAKASQTSCRLCNLCTRAMTLQFHTLHRPAHGAELAARKMWRFRSTFRVSPRPSSCQMDPSWIWPETHFAPTPKHEWGTGKYDKHTTMPNCFATSLCLRNLQCLWEWQGPGGISSNGLEVDALCTKTWFWRWGKTRKTQSLFCCTSIH